MQGCGRPYIIIAQASVIACNTTDQQGGGLGGVVWLSLEYTGAAKHRDPNTSQESKSSFQYGTGLHLIRNTKMQGVG